MTSVLHLKKIPTAKLLYCSSVWCAEIVILNVINRPSSICKKIKIQWGMGMVNSQDRVIGVHSLDRFLRRFFFFVKQCLDHVLGKVR